MKYNFNKKTKLACILLIMLLFGGLIKLIGKKEEINYSNIDIHNTINTATITETSSEIEEDLNKDQDETHDKIAYITIDDGPSKYTSQILDILNKNDVKATFFMINGNMKKYQR